VSHALLNTPESGDSDDAMSSSVCLWKSQFVSCALWNVTKVVMLMMSCPFILHSALEITACELCIP
jgi:hypothetical protein